MLIEQAFIGCLLLDPKVGTCGVKAEHMTSSEGRAALHALEESGVTDINLLVVKYKLLSKVLRRLLP